MKTRSSISITLFASTKSTKVLRRLGNNVGAQFHDDAASAVAVDGYVEVYLGVGLPVAMAAVYDSERGESGQRENVGPEQ